MAKDPWKYVLFTLPALAVGAVALSLLVFGVPRPYAAARLRGGATEGATVLSLRIEAFRRLRDVEVPLAVESLRLEVSFPGGASSAWSGVTDERGLAEAFVRVPSGPLEKPVSARVFGASSRHPLAEGDLWLPIAESVRATSRRGGRVDGNRAGELTVAAEPVRGTFAVPFSELLAISVSRDGAKVAGATVSVTAAGATVEYPFGTSTDVAGLLRVALAPREHAIPVEVRAVSDAGTGTLEFMLPVVPGAMRASGTPERLVIESPIERDVAYVSLVDGVHRLRGAVVPLAPDGRGGAVGTVTFAPPVEEDVPLWAVVSSEADTHSMARLGWPIGGAPAGTPSPRHTLDLPDHLLLDGAPAGHLRDAARQRRVRWLTAVFSGLAMALAVALIALRARQARAELEATLARAGEEQATAVSRTGSASGWVLLVALLCVALGFAALSLVTTFRM